MGPDHPLHNLIFQCFENNPEKRLSEDELVETLRQFCNSNCKISGGTTVGKVECMRHLLTNVVILYHMITRLQRAYLSTLGFNEVVQVLSSIKCLFHGK